MSLESLSIAVAAALMHITGMELSIKSVPGPRFPSNLEPYIVGNISQASGTFSP
jgi:hypothetical protein